ncbi:MAG: hypothetical protein ACUVQ2_00570 [Dissulfurimicrobium sp.]
MDIGKEYRIVFVNRAATMYLSREIKDVTGLPCKELFTKEL